jgi:hypothetical protein
MAQKVAVTYVDDIDGSKAAETVAFGLDGAQYEIDLSARNAKSLRKALAEFQAAGRRVPSAGALVSGGGGRTAAPRSRPHRITRAETAASNAAIRQWASSNGIEVSARGRLSDSLREQYAAAHS